MKIECFSKDKMSLMENKTADDFYLLSATS